MKAVHYTIYFLHKIALNVLPIDVISIHIQNMLNSNYNYPCSFIIVENDDQ